ncbi:DUF6735 family protein [Halarchaeum sp. P4]|uniref:DUF6735 family protein n=1 Tax=Halarchaeum sp. P4 TaxID=3421639 RepID=UPI003EC043D1
MPTNTNPCRRPHRRRFRHRGGESRTPTRVHIDPCAVSVTLEEIRREYLDDLAHEAFYVVDCDDWQLRGTAYSRVLGWLRGRRDDGAPDADRRP